MKSALVIIDMQKLFKNLKKLEFESVLVPNIEKVLNVARNKNMPLSILELYIKKIRVISQELECIMKKCGVKKIA